MRTFRRPKSTCTQRSTRASESKVRRHEGEHDIFPWVTHFLFVCRRAYKEFVVRAERLGTRQGAKADLLEFALERMTGPFGIADVQRLCSGVSRDTVRLVMNRWRENGRLEILGRGDKWRRTG